MQQLLGDAGFGEARVVPLAPDARVKGPALFVATATKPRKHEMCFRGGSEEMTWPQ